VLRRRPALAGCSYGEHAIWWTVEAADERHALALLPFFVAQRSMVTRVADIVIP
jgi:aminoglycoside phosphotransferase family enzyme